MNSGPSGQAPGVHRTGGSPGGDLTDRATSSPAARSSAFDPAALHRSLTTVVATGQSVYGIASVLHRATGRTVVIDDAEGNRLTHAGGEDAPLGALPAPVHDRTDEHARAVRIDGWVLAVVRPGVDRLGVVALHDPEGHTGDSEAGALELGALVLATELFRLHSVASNELRVWGDLAAELLDDPDVERARSHSAALGYAIDRPHRAFLIERTGSHEPPPVATVRRAFRAAGLDGRLITQRHQDIVCFVDGSADPTALARALHDEGPSDLRLGFGDLHDTTDLGLSVGEAELALRLSCADVIGFAELGIACFLAADADPARLHAFVDAWIGPLEAYDRAHRSELVHTLRLYLLGQRSARACADALHIHPSTLKYRLRRIQDLTGRDLHDPEARFNLDLACRIRSTLAARDLPAPVRPDSRSGSADGVDGPVAARAGHPTSPAVVEVAVLDRDGVVSSVNGAWAEFCTTNGGDLSRSGTGASYLDACDGAAGDPWADLAGSLVRLAIGGHLPAPARLTLPCHSPDTSRWFEMTVASRHDDSGWCCGAEVTLTPTTVH